MNEFKMIHQAEDRNQAMKRLSEFVQHWKVKYPRAIRQIQKYDDLSLFMIFQVRFVIVFTLQI